MRHHISAFVILGALIASGCSGGGGTPHTSASPTASASASPTPSGSASPTPTPSGSPALTSTGLYVEAAYPNSFTQVTTTLTVPAEPPATGDLIVWPGLVPADTTGNTTFLPINEGILQTVLTWGSTCAPGTQPTPYSTWWVSAQYNNELGSQAGYTGCQGGPIMSVNPGDSLVETLTLNGTTWNEQIADQTTSQSVSFPIDLEGQTQNVLFFLIDGLGQNLASPVTFTNTTFTTSTPFTSASQCELATAATYENDTQSTPTLNGNTCSIASITLLPAASPVPALRTHAPASAARFPAPVLPGRLPAR